MRIVVIGSGAREHAIVRALAQGREHELHAVPGNPGIGRLATLHDVSPTDGEAVADLARAIGADLVVVGPEVPLVAGVADAVRGVGIPCFGPGAEAAALEGSKAFAKEVMAAAAVPTAMARVCTTQDELAEALDVFGAPYVVKDDGLAAGKGVVVTQDRDVALEHGRACLERRVSAGDRPAVVVEEYLDGPEVSLFCVCDGQHVVPLAPAQDFKRALDGDEGPNTGGMGAYSPLPWAPPDLVDEVLTRVARPTVDEMRRRGTPFVGVLYCGLALTSRGVRVVEFNVRFGDPETQVVLARLATPLAEVLLAAATGELEALPALRWRDEAAVTVVVAAHGYPGTVRAGDEIEGVAAAEGLPGVHVLHAGTARSSDGALVSAGGRVLSVVGLGADVAEARDRAYAGVTAIALRGSHHRTDIAAHLPPRPDVPLVVESRSDDQRDDISTVLGSDELR
ncbi:phosphoribosylamine--glycine ligase [Isoptericola sp. b441]|uniref:Phosphoribosylamine--glycine ligase n=1 Tax=Actinotalea lenta TaxID=3064654 RepID=A0ABT9D5Z3_9CELL|nr:phosphoribosylamine--glycine ligase [Isoptericola sp. b441]MDO8105910.1 phosphoribosylamine--glycine ligase [Isoptericola sp. b441]